MMLRLFPVLGGVLLVLIPLEGAAEPQTPRVHASERAARRSQAQIDRLQHFYERHMKRCGSNDEYACDNARDELAQIQTIKAALPAAQ